MAQIALPKMLADANAAEEAGKLGVAQAILGKATKDYPKDPKPLLRLVRLLSRKGKEPKLALPLLPRLLKLAPNSGLAHELAAETYCKLRHYEIALVHADKALALAPKSPDTLYVAATVYQFNARHDETIRLINRALSLRPDHRPSKFLLASSLNASGQQKEAEAICRAIFAESPSNAHNLMLWNRTVKASVDDPIYQYLSKTLLPEFTRTGDPRLQMVLRILGKSENDIGNYVQSFKYYTQAKTLDTNRHDRSKNKRFVGELLANTSRADFFSVQGNESESPVLIVGMPRTGSTLLEQILSSHPEIGGIGESPELRSLAASVGFRSDDGAGLARLARDLSPQKAKELAEIYLKKSKSIAPGKLRIVDKNLHNFELLGLFARMFPKGRVILALRDPLDNCVSCYLQPLNEFHSYTQDLTSLGQYYADFRRLVAHWQKVIPNPMMEVHYEDMVADTEGMARKIIDFIGLEWDPACLSFQENKSHVRTLSVSQVRQPIYKTAVKRWQRYEEFLDPLKAELAHLYPDGF